MGGRDPSIWAICHLLPPRVILARNRDMEQMLVSNRGTLMCNMTSWHYVTARLNAHHMKFWHSPERSCCWLGMGTGRLAHWSSSWIFLRRGQQPHIRSWMLRPYLTYCVGWQKYFESRSVAVQKQFEGNSFKVVIQRIFCITETPTVISQLEMLPPHSERLNVMRERGISMG